MFTVKFIKNGECLIVEADTVRVGSSAEGLEPVVYTWNGSSLVMRIISECESTQFGEGLEVYYLAYIENANGKTTEVVKPCDID